LDIKESLNGSYQNVEYIASDFSAEMIDKLRKIVVPKEFPMKLLVEQIDAQVILIPFQL
jgi:hypothetical protein